MEDFGFHPIFIPGDTGEPVLLLLHGTGGNERDLIPLAQELAPRRAILTVRGRVLENGMPRFFRRLAEGVFDQEDLAFRTGELADFVKAAKQHYGIARPLIALGYSNGANIAASLLLQRPETLDGAILLRAMMPYHPDILPDLTGKRILMLNGLMDPIVAPDNAKRLARLFGEAGAGITFKLQPASHGLAPSDLGGMREWLGQ